MGAEAAVLFVFMLVMLWLAYPLALPYPVVIVGAVALATGSDPSCPSVARARAWIVVPIGLLLLAPAVVGAVLKLKEAISQLLTPGSELWGGDIHRLLPVGPFLGVGGGIAAALPILVLAAIGAYTGLQGRQRVAIIGVLSALCLLDLRFRLVKSGAYMDYKHLTFVGVFHPRPGGEPRDAPAVRGRTGPAARRPPARCCSWPGRSRRWSRTAPTLFLLPAQVDAQMFQIRSWVDHLPPGATVRVDIPPNELGGTQLWAVYMVGSHPVSSTDPVRGTTYAYPNGGYRADYALELRYNPAYGPESTVPQPSEWFAVNPPVDENSQFVLRRVVWPRTGPYAGYTDNSSTTLNEP